MFAVSTQSETRFWRNSIFNESSPRSHTNVTRKFAPLIEWNLWNGSAVAVREEQDPRPT